MDVMTAGGGAAARDGCGSTWDDQSCRSATSKAQYTCGSSSRQWLTRSRWPLGISYSQWTAQQRESMDSRSYCKACLAAAKAAPAAVPRAPVPSSAALPSPSPAPSQAPHSPLRVHVEEEKKAPFSVHVGYYCDGCGTAPITGTRYRCSLCPSRPGFDLCESCRERGDLHPADHPLRAFPLPLPPRSSVSGNGLVAATMARAPPAVIDRVLPDSGLVSERTRILIAGENFLSGSVVRIGDLACSEVVVLSDTVIACLTPASLPEGELMVTVAHPSAPSAAAVLEEGYWAYRDPSLDELEIILLEPAEGPSRGDTHLEVTVRGLQDGPVSVFIGGVGCNHPVRIPGTDTVRCMTGSAAQGADDLCDVRVTNGGRTVSQPAAFRYLPAVDPNRRRLEAVLVEPACAAEGSTVEIMVAGLLDDGSAVSVSMGGAACQVVYVEAEEARVYCQLGPHSAGEVDIVVSQGRSVASLARGFTYAPSAQARSLPQYPQPQQQAQQQPWIRSSSPRAGQPAGEAAAPPVFRQYRGSEVEDLAKARRIRLADEDWLSEASIQGERVGIEASDIPRAQAEVFTVVHAELARRCGLRRGDSLTQADILANRNSEELVSALVDERLIARSSSGLNPAYHSRPMSRAEQLYVDRLRASIRQRIAERDRGGQRVLLGDGRAAAQQPVLRLYVGQHSQGGTLHVNSHPYDSEQLTLQLAAVAHDQEEQAVTSLINLACNFDYQHAEAKRAFIDAFTSVLVIKQFPSLGLRQFYFHCILRCGTIE